MSNLNIAQISAMVLSLALFVYHFIQDMPIDMRFMEPECLHNTIESNKFCDIVLNNYHRGIFLRNETMTSPILEAKFKTLAVHPAIYYRFLWDQIDFIHILDDVILNQRFILCFAFMTLCLVLIEVVVLSKMYVLIKNPEYRKQIDQVRWREYRLCMLNFLVQKSAVLLFCVTRTPEKPQNKHYIDFGEYVRDTLSPRTRYTDATLFACFYCLLAICHLASNSIFDRFRHTVLLMERRKKTKLRGETCFMATFLVLISVVTLSGILLGGSFVSVAFLHPDYSMILVFESLKMFIRCLYVLDRLAQCVSPTRMAQIESKKRLNDVQITEILVTGYQKGVTGKTFQNIYLHSTLIINVILNGFFVKNGFFTNQKLPAIFFVSSAVHTVFLHTSYNEIPTTSLL